MTFAETAILVALFIYVIAVVVILLKTEKPKQQKPTYTCIVCGTKFDGSICPKCGWIRDVKK